MPCETTVSGNLAGLTLTPGVCRAGAIGITGTLTLNFEGDLQIQGTLEITAKIYELNVGKSRSMMRTAASRLRHRPGSRK